MEGTETSRDRPAPPAPRWRALLDRARSKPADGGADPGDDLSWLDGTGRAVPAPPANPARSWRDDDGDTDEWTLPTPPEPTPPAPTPTAASTAAPSRSYASASRGLDDRHYSDRRPDIFGSIFEAPELDQVPAAPYDQPEAAAPGLGARLSAELPTQQLPQHGPRESTPLAYPAVPPHPAPPRATATARPLPPPQVEALEFPQPQAAEPASTAWAGRPLEVTEPALAQHPLLAGVGGELQWRQTAPLPADDPAAQLRRSFGRPRVIAFANPKGGVHKTTATVLAAATVGAVRGRGVVAWDDNELRGTLGLRAGSARHARTIRHLVADLDDFADPDVEAVRQQLDDYLRHAADGTYDILAGEENPRFAQQLDAETVRRVLGVLRRTHEVICVDTGNNVQSANWQAVLRGCDQLVVTTVPREDAAFAADWMLDVLHDMGLSDLVDNAVTLLSGASPEPSLLQDDLEHHFAGRTRAVARVPYDPVLETGSWIDHHGLQPATRAAWVSAAATMLAPFAGS